MTTKQLKSKLDRIFSIYIRERDTKNGHGFCISCGKPVTFSTGDAGHYYSRNISCLRYDEKNVNIQCRHCNRFMEGNKQGYTLGLVKKYGQDVLELLAIKKGNSCKLGTFELGALISEYEEKNKQSNNF